jgi:hypothetical protein
LRNDETDALSYAENNLFAYYKMRIIKRPRTIRRPRANKRANKRSIKTRRQTTGGWMLGWKSFITADENPMVGGASGIDVKVKLHNNQPQWWLIGGNNETFMDLLVSAKDGRYYKFITKLQETYPNFDSFTNPGEFTYTSKGIKLSPHQFCKLFITEPYILDYPELRKEFTRRDFKCPTDQEEALPPRDDSRISSFEKREIDAKDATKRLHYQLKHVQREQSNHELIMGNLDKALGLASGLPKRQDVISGVDRGVDRGVEVN